MIDTNISPPALAAGSASLSVGIEEGTDGSALVHSLGFPGCVSFGPSVQQALEAFANELSAWLSFRESIGLAVPEAELEVEITVDEWIASAARVAAGESEVIFDADLAPLSDREINEGLHLLGDLRGRLLRALRGVPRAELSAVSLDPLALPRILDELARAQWWTLTRLGASPLAELPEVPVGRLDTAMALVVQQFTGFVRETRDRVLELEGEVWTPRKVLRRLLWLEWSVGGAALAAVEARSAP